MEVVDPQLEAIVETMLSLDPTDGRFPLQYGYLKGQLDMIRGVAFFEEDVYAMAAEPEAEEEVRTRLSTLFKNKIKALYFKILGRR